MNQINLLDTLKVLKRITPWNFELFIDGNWGNSTQDFRKIIRQELSQRFMFKNDVFDLSQIPLPIKGSISISHCHELGVIAFCSDRSIGIDIEHTDRVKTDIIKRVCKPSELEFPVTPDLIWAAKESAFKACYPAKPQTISEIELLSFTDIDKKYFRFKAQHLKTGKLVEGLSHRLDEGTENNYALAIAWMKGPGLT